MLRSTLLQLCLMSAAWGFVGFRWVVPPNGQNGMAWLQPGCKEECQGGDLWCYGIRGFQGAFKLPVGIHSIRSLFLFWGGNHSGNFGVLRFVRLCQIVMCENFRPGKGKDQICGVCLACFGGHQDVMPQKVTKDVRLVGRYDIEQRQQRLEGFLESQTQTLQSCLDMWQLSWFKKIVDALLGPCRFQMRCQSGGCQEMIVQLPSQDFPGRELFGLTLSRRYLDWRLDCHSGFCLWEGVFRLILLHGSMLLVLANYQKTWSP